jgi:long-chain fatty acid transport protein
MTRKRWLLAPVYSLLCSLCIDQVAHAGGLDQTTFSPLILFEDGGYAEISAQRRDITVSGALVAAPNVGAQNVLQNPTTLNLGYKQDLGDRMGVALQFTTPDAANTAYHAAGYPLNGTTATLESRAITALLSYDIGQNAFAYGRLRLLQSDGDIYVSLNAGLPNVFSYRFDGEIDTGLGYVLGLAYSRPEFGTRLALGYTSPIDLTFSGQEGRVLGAAGATPALSDTRFGVEMPATLSLDLQQGIATNTAFLGRIQQSRWGGT